MRGRKPLPESEMRLRGSRNLTRYGRRNGPPAENIQSLTPPETLDSERQKHWDRVTRFMANAGTLGQVSSYVLVRYVDLLVMFDSTRSEKNLARRINTQCAISRHLSTMESKLGLTPADARNVVPASPKTESVVDRLIRE